MSIYMKYGDIKGSVTDDKYKDTVELTGFEFGAGRGVSMKVGAEDEREATKPAFSELRVMKQLDKSTTDFFQEAISGDGNKKCAFYFVKTEGSSTQCYLEVEIENAMLSSWHIEGNGGNPTVTMTIAYTKVMQKNMERDKDNKSGTPKSAGYDLSKASKL